MQSYEASKPPRDISALHIVACTQSPTNSLRAGTDLLDPCLPSPPSPYRGLDWVRGTCSCAKATDFEATQGSAIAQRRAIEDASKVTHDQLELSFLEVSMVLISRDVIFGKLEDKEQRTDPCRLSETTAPRGELQHI